MESIKMIKTLSVLTEDKLKLNDIKSVQHIAEVNLEAKVDLEVMSPKVIFTMNSGEKKTSSNNEELLVFINTLK